VDCVRRYVEEHRRRQVARGLKRVEVLVPNNDSDLIRRLGKALAGDDDAAVKLRAAIDKVLTENGAVPFREWIATTDDDDK
jgi:hypothetical protein